MSEDNRPSALVYIGPGLALGAGLGIVFGETVFGDAGIGLVIGAGIGLLFGTVYNALKVKKDAGKNGK